MNPVTRLLVAARRGEADAAERLLDAVYAELHRMAEQKLAGESGATLQPTALVHDAWLQLSDNDGVVAFENRPHFFGAAAQAMRRILIDRARRRQAEKRGGGVEHVNLEDVDIAVNANDETLLRLDDALERLEREDPASAELVRLRFYAGMTNDEAAEVLGISERTAKRYWNFSRAWLFDALSGGTQ
jgi:RNA polymerase sigma factor (TIGR02999 family)